MDDGVSYLISLYNKRDYIEKTLAAVHGEWRTTGGEIIVYDDVSTDDSVELVRRLPFAADITLILGHKNGGCVLATDRLILAARCPAVRFVDGDDLVIPGTTATMLAAARHDGCALLFGRLGTIGDSVDPADGGGPPRRIADPLRFILKNTAFNPSAMLVATAALKRVYPLPVQLRHSQDFIIGLRMALGGGSFCAYDSVVALAPPEDDNRLSRHMAEMFGNMTETVALEAGNETFPLAALRYATARYASRCLRYFRRSRRRGLGTIDRVRLTTIVVGARFASMASCRRDLDHIARMFYRDRGHVVGAAPARG